MHRLEFTRGNFTDKKLLDRWESSEYVVLARGDEFADALAGVPLAYSLDAPILLTPPTALNPATRQEILDLQAEKVIILGGEGAVSRTIEDELKTAMGLDVERIAGGNRFDTASKIAQRMQADENYMGKVMIANGLDFPDALAASAYAARLGYPIILTRAEFIPGSTGAALAELDPEEYLVVGGPGVVSAEVMAELPNSIRISGTNRYWTAAALADYFDPGSSRFYVATGLDFADAIAGGVLAAKNDGALLLVSSWVHPAVVEYIDNNWVPFATIFGGPGAVSEEVEAGLEALLASAVFTQAVTAAQSAIDALPGLVAGAANSTEAQGYIDAAQGLIDAVLALDEDYDTSAWDAVIAAQQAIVDAMADLEAAVTAAQSAIDALPGLVAAAADSTEAQGYIDSAQGLIDAVLALDEDYDTSAWDAVIVAQQAIVDAMADLEAAVTAAQSAIDALPGLVAGAANSTEAQGYIDNAQDLIDAVLDLDENYDTSAWDAVIAAQQAIVDAMGITHLMVDEDSSDLDKLVGLKAGDVVDEFGLSVFVKTENGNKAYNAKATLAITDPSGTEIFNETITLGDIEAGVYETATFDLSSITLVAGTYQAVVTLDADNQDARTLDAWDVVVAPYVELEVSSDVPTFTEGEQQEFTVSTEANDDAGRMVRAHFTLPDGVAVEYLEQNPSHPDFGKWLPLTGDVYGPSAGFPLTDAQSQFRATFDTPGEYEVTIEFKEVGTGEVVASHTLEITVEMAETHLMVDEDSSDLDKLVGLKAGDVVDEFGLSVFVKTENGNKAYNAKATLAITDPSGTEIFNETITLGDIEAGVYETATFDLSGITLVAGTYQAVVTLDADNQDARTLDAWDVVVAAPMAITSELPNFVAGRPDTFTVGTIANDDSGKMVRAHFNLPDGVTLEYKEGGQGDWIKLDDVFGPAEGFPLGDITTTFRGTFETAGSYDVTVEFRTVDGNELLGIETFTAVVEDAMEITSDLPTFIAGRPDTFTVGTTANGDTGKMVRAHFNLPDGATVEYREGGQGDWIELVDVFGPAEGFPLADITTTFRGTFETAGSYEVTVEFRTVEGNELLGTETFTVEVQPYYVEALQAVNEATTDGAMKEALEDYAEVLGLDLTDYNALTASRKLSVANFVLDNRGEGSFTDVEAVQAAFNAGVEYQSGLQAFQDAAVAKNIDSNAVQAIRDTYYNMGQFQGVSEDEDLVAVLTLLDSYLDLDAGQQGEVSQYIYDNANLYDRTSVLEAMNIAVQYLAAVNTAEIQPAGAISDEGIYWGVVLDGVSPQDAELIIWQKADGSFVEVPHDNTTKLYLNKMETADAVIKVYYLVDGNWTVLTAEYADTGYLSKLNGQYIDFADYVPEETSVQPASLVGEHDPWWIIELEDLIPNEVDQILWQRADGSVVNNDHSNTTKLYLNKVETADAVIKVYYLVDGNWTVLTAEYADTGYLSKLNGQYVWPAPILESICPAEGDILLGANETFKLVVDAHDEYGLYELEIDHNMSNLPEFSVYADAANPYGDSAADFESYGVTVTYDADEQKWEIDFGATVTDAFVEKGEVKFYIVLKDLAGNQWGTMYGTTPENTFVYNISRPNVINRTQNKGYDTIQDAIDEAGTLDTILVGPGTYSVELHIDLPINLVGAGIDQTILEPTEETLEKNAPKLIYLGSKSDLSGTTIEGFTFVSPSEGKMDEAAISLRAYGSSNDPIIIRNNKFVGSDNGIGILSPYGNYEYVEITGNDFSDLKYAMYFNTIRYADIHANEIDRTKYAGIVVAGNSNNLCYNVSIHDSTLTNISWQSKETYSNPMYDSGICILEHTEDITVENNDISMLEDKLEIFWFVKADFGFTAPAITAGDPDVSGFEITVKNVDRIADDVSLRYLMEVTEGNLDGVRIGYGANPDEDTFTITDGQAYFGPAVGFTLTDLPALKGDPGATTPFTIKDGLAAGTYKFTVSIVEVGGQTLVTSEEFEFAVDEEATLPSLEGVSPAEGDILLGKDDTFKLVVDAHDEYGLYELEIDHNMSNLPEFSVYADAANPYGDSAADFESYGVTVTYDADEQKWEIDFGATVTDAFVDKGEVKFYIVLKDLAGNQWGTMYGTTPENTFVYNITRDANDPELEGVSPAEGDILLGKDDTFKLIVDAHDEEGLYELEIDHNMSNLPEFSVYADAANPYGDSAADFAAAGVTVTYDADEQKWEIDFGATVTDAFVDKGEVKFYIVLKDLAGNQWGTMYGTTPENTFVYNIYRLSTYEFGYEVPDQVIEGREVIVPVTFSTDELGTMGLKGVQFRFESDKTGVTFKATDTNNVEHTFTDSGVWGPAGFDIPADYTATTDWTLTFAAAGDYTITFRLVEVATGTELYEASENITVKTPANFEVTAFSAPSSVNKGDEIGDQVTATVVNTGGIAETQTIEIKMVWDFSQDLWTPVLLYSVEVTLAPGESYQIADLSPSDISLSSSLGTGSWEIGIFTEDDEQIRNMYVS